MRAKRDEGGRRAETSVRLSLHCDEEGVVVDLGHFGDADGEGRSAGGGASQWRLEIIDVRQGCVDDLGRYLDLDQHGARRQRWRQQRTSTYGRYRRGIDA